MEFNLKNEKSIYNNSYYSYYGPYRLNPLDAQSLVDGPNYNSFPCLGICGLFSKIR